MTGNGLGVQGPQHGLRSLEGSLRGTYSAGDRPLHDFYIPALAVACRYDRMAGYFSSGALAAAAVGIRRFIDNARRHDGKMRLIVGAQLSPDDVDAVRAGAASRAQAVAAALAREPLLDTDPTVMLTDALAEQDAAQSATGVYVRMLAWMVRQGLLDIKVGIPVDAHGDPLPPQAAAPYFHSKVGILSDECGDHIAFIGSSNETAAGWLNNHETFSTAPSWQPTVWNWQGVEAQQRFDNHWQGAPDSGWWVTDLATVDDRLLTLIGHDYTLPDVEPLLLPPFSHNAGDDTSPSPSDPDMVDAEADLASLAALPREHPYTAAMTAPATPLPHQETLLTRAAGTYPRGYLFADPVGFGKTLEIGFTLRELLLSGKATTALILTPASVVRQWQEELAEKVGLLVPRYESGTFIAPDGRELEQPANTYPWSAFPVVLASSHLARRRARRAEVIAAGPWDIVVVDEAHHARRRGSKPNDSASSLLTLLRSMHDKQSWKALYLATATPMQMHPHEVWDLLALLDLPGRWARSAADFQNYYQTLRLTPQERDWAMLNAMLADYFTDPDALRDTDLASQIYKRLGVVKAKKIVSLGSPHNLQGMPQETAQRLGPDESAMLDNWLRRHTPMRDRAFRSTRDTLRAYQAAGIISPDVNIPERHVKDVFIELNPEWERPLYDRIEEYISRYYNAYMAKGAKALGFIMTIYRRRLTSSFHAIRRSLERRLAALESGSRLEELLAADDATAIETTLFDMDDLDIALELLGNEIRELSAFVTELQALTGQDTKATQLVDDLREAFHTYDSAVVFTQYTDTMDYVRERLIAAGYTSIGCYSGRGGEIWNPATHTWTDVSKTHIKNQFRSGEVKILLGTDSMSEGLNLQTASVLINYDLPWNLMRVEQRCGRIDRIGAARPDVYITNYFYADTVEQTVYDGIRVGFDDFTDIIGSAQPVLGTIEKAIEELALADKAGRDRAITQQVTSIRGDIARAEAEPVHLDDIGTHTDTGDDYTPLTPAITLDEIESRLTSNPLTAPLFTPDSEQAHVYLLDEAFANTIDGMWHPGQSPTRVTFDRDTADETGYPLITYGHPIFDALTALHWRP